VDVNRLSSLTSRVFIAAAVVLFAAGILEWILARVGVSLWLGYMPSRFLELAAFSLLPVMVVLLRQIREGLRQHKPL
jgi:hypothetical protein